MLGFKMLTKARMDRPSRKSKVVNYCESKDFDDDDDFAQTRAPPSKKAREEGRQEQKKSISKSCSQETNSQLCERSRKPLDEKLYERDLEAAITLSQLNNSDGTKFPTSKGDIKAQILFDENTDPTTLHLTNCSVDAVVLGLDRIAAESGSSATQRKPASKASETQRKRDEDEDYQPKLTPDSESEEEFSEPAESEEEEFTIKKANKTKKKEKTTKNKKTKPVPASKTEKQPSKPSQCKPQAADSTPVRSPTAKLAPARPASSLSASTLKPAACLSPTGGRVPKWNPPAQVGRSPPTSQSPAVKSPGQGLRLGLSRLVRVKPLHPSVASH